MPTTPAVGPPGGVHGGSTDARLRWELENEVEMVDGKSPSSSASLSAVNHCVGADASSSVDALFRYDEVETARINQNKPWSRDPHFFKRVRISALALLKMVMHARSGGNLEVMGLMQGKVVGDTFVVVDSFALPVEGTETRVSAQNEAYEYMVQYLEKSQDAGRREVIVGWYHSHPGYGCWMSGIDCSTQMHNQTFQDPFLAVVIDPHRTMAAGKVEIGAFRTFPENYKPPDAGPSEYQTIPLDKIEDYGVHSNSYYPLETSFFKSSMDAKLLEVLWDRYWINTLSTSPLVTSRAFVEDQMWDLAQKLEQAETQLAHSGRMHGFFMVSDQRKGARPSEESPLVKIVKDASKIATEQINGIITQLVKDAAFNVNPPGIRTSSNGDADMPDAHLQTSRPTLASFMGRHST